MKKKQYDKRNEVVEPVVRRQNAMPESQKQGVIKGPTLAGMLFFFMLFQPLCMGLSASAQAAAMTGNANEVSVRGGLDSELSLNSFLSKVIEKNSEIQIQKREWLANEKLNSASRGIYEPVIKVSVNREGNHVQNNVQQSLQRLYSPEFRETNNVWSASLEGLTPTGSTWRLGSEVKKLQNNLQSTGDKEYVAFIGASLTQPLLKGGGLHATSANIHVARANADIAYEGYRQSRIETVARGVQLYWQCYGAQEKLKMRQRSVAIADEMLQLNKKRYEAGKIDYMGVLDAESGLRLRKALVAAAEQTELTAKTNLLSLFGVRSLAQNPVSFRAIDAPECPAVTMDYEKSLSRAYSSYPQYRSALRTADRERERMYFASNQRLPQLDVKGSYGYNGLATDFQASLDKALQKEYLSWSVGVDVSIPLLGNIKNRNEYDAARLRKEQAQDRLEMQRVELANQMEIVAGLVQRVYDQVLNYERVVALNGQLTKAEEMRFRLGKSDVRIMLEREENYLKVRESLLDSRLAYQYALINHYALEGTLFEHYGLSETDKNRREYR